MFGVFETNEVADMQLALDGDEVEVGDAFNEVGYDGDGVEDGVVVNDDLNSGCELKETNEEL